MPHIPERVKDLSIVPIAKKYLIGQGKTRDMYRLPEFPGCLVIVASNRISIFDFVLPFDVSGKGTALTAMTKGWLTGPLRRFTNHLTGWPSAPLDYQGQLERLFQLYPEFPREQTIMVLEQQIMPVEIIFRMHFGGSVWEDYLAGELISGLRLPAGMKKWQKLDLPLFTPTTKEAEGHDQNMTVQEFEELHGSQGMATMQTFRQAFVEAYQYALERGYLILDTKFEGTLSGMLCDEALTGDSSRYTRVDDFELGKDPAFADKELVRQWGRKIQTPFQDKSGASIVGLHNKALNNVPREDVLAFIDSLEPPTELIQQTSQNYARLAYNLFG